MELCTLRCLPKLSELAAFCLIDNSVSWRDKNVDQLSLEVLSHFEGRKNSEHDRYRRGKPNDLINTYNNLCVLMFRMGNKRKVSEYMSPFIAGLPTTDLLSRFSGEAKDSLFGMCLFCTSFPTRLFPDSFFDALCN